MNFFGVGGWEILLILLIMLIVAGPKRMLQWAYFGGRILAQIRGMWSQAMDGIQRELDDAGVDFKVPKQLSRNEMNRAARDFIKPFEDQYREAEREYKQEVKALDSSIKGADQANGATSASNNGTSNNTNTEESTSKPAPSSSSRSSSPPATSSSYGTWSGAKPQSPADNGDASDDNGE